MKTINRLFVAVILLCVSYGVTAQDATKELIQSVKSIKQKIDKAKAESPKTKAKIEKAFSDALSPGATWDQIKKAIQLTSSMPYPYVLDNMIEVPNLNSYYYSDYKGPTPEFKTNEAGELTRTFDYKFIDSVSIPDTLVTWHGLIVENEGNQIPGGAKKWGDVAIGPEVDPYFKERSSSYNGFWISLIMQRSNNTVKYTQTIKCGFSLDISYKWDGYYYNNIANPILTAKAIKPGESQRVCVAYKYLDLYASQEAKAVKDVNDKAAEEILAKQKKAAEEKLAKQKKEAEEKLAKQKKEAEEKLAKQMLEMRGKGIVHEGKVYTWSDLLKIEKDIIASTPNLPKQHTTKTVNGFTVVKTDEEETIEKNDDYYPGRSFWHYRVNTYSKYSAVNEVLRIYDYELTKNKGVSSVIMDISGGNHTIRSLKTHKFAYFPFLEAQFSGYLTNNKANHNNHKTQIYVIDLDTGVVFDQYWLFESCRYHIPQEKYVGQEYYDTATLEKVKCVGVVPWISSYNGAYDGRVYYYLAMEKNSNASPFCVEEKSLYGGSYLKKTLADLLNSQKDTKIGLLSIYFHQGKPYFRDQGAGYPLLANINKSTYIYIYSDPEMQHCIIRTWFGRRAESVVDYIPTYEQLRQMKFYDVDENAVFLLPLEEYNKALKGEEKIHDSNRKEQIGYDMLVAKYGQKAADAVLDGTGVYVGMPGELAIKLYKGVLSIDHGNSQCWDMYNAFGDKCGWMWIDDGVVSSVSWY